MPFIRKVVTKKSDDGTFQVGDHIEVNSDGSISCIEAEGWIDAEDATEASKGMESIPDREWIQSRKDKLRAELGILET